MNSWRSTSKKVESIEQDTVTSYNDALDKLVELQNEIRYADGPKALELKSKYISLEKKTHDTFVKPKLDEAEKAQKDINLADQNVVYY